MLAFSALVAGSFSLGALSANLIDPGVLNAVRFALSAIVVGLVAYLSGGLSRETFKAPWRFFLLGAVFASYFVLMFEGLKTAPPVSTAAVFTLMPIMTAGFGWLLLRQVTTLRMAVALAIGATGALWVIFRADLELLLRFDVGRGELVYFAGCIAHALYVPLLRKLNRGESAIAFSFGVLAAGAVVLGLWAAPDIIATDWGALPLIVWITLAYIVFAATSATFTLLQFATLRLPGAKVMAYTYLTPSWVIVWEAALGHGVPAAITLGGVALTILALLLLLKD